MLDIMKKTGEVSKIHLQLINENVSALHSTIEKVLDEHVPPVKVKENLT